MKSLFSTSLLATLGLVALIAAPAQAQTTVYNNLFNAAGVASYDHDISWFTGTPPGFLGGGVGFAFKPSSSGSLFDVSLVLLSSTDAFSNIYLREASPVPDKLTGAILESWSFNNIESGIQNLSSVSHPFLDSSKTYFLYEEDNDHWIKSWYVNNQNDFDSAIVEDSHGDYIPIDGYLKGAFRVRATPMALTPEAPGLMQLLPGLLPVGLLIAKRRRLKKSA